MLLGGINQRTQTRRTLYLSIVRCHLGYATQVWSPQSIGLLKRVENVQRRATKLILKLPFSFDVTYNTRLQLTNLLPISYWHEFLDIVFFYKAVNNLVFIDSEALPATRQSTRSTRSSSSNAITYIPKRSRTVTYQRSFFIRSFSIFLVYISVALVLIVVVFFSMIVLFCFLINEGSTVIG